MYQFIDVNEQTSAVTLPSEALQIDGEYIEHLIPGYRTLYVSGRETLSPEIETFNIASRDGTNLKSKRLPARTITVGYQLIASTNAAFRAAFNQLASILSGTEHELIFADESDKFFTGTVQEYGDVEPGRNAVTSEIVFMCQDPYKYSVAEYEGVYTESEEGGFFSVDYSGTCPSYPKLEAHFYETDETDNTDGDCGYVAFVNQSEKILQFGDPEDPDKIEQIVDRIMTQESSTKVTTKSKALVNHTFNSNTSGWSANAGMTSSSKYSQAGSVTVAKLTTSGSKVVKPSSFGSGSYTSWHGPSITRTLPSDGGSPATTGALNWSFHSTVRFCGGKETVNNETGAFQVWIMGPSGYIAGVSMWKAKGSSKGSVRVYARGVDAVKTWDNIGFSYTNTRFGYKKKSSDTRPLNVDITKSGNKLTFNVGGLTYTYSTSNIASVIAKKVCLWFGKNASTSALSYMGCYSCKFTSTSVSVTSVQDATWEDVYGMVDKPNVFTSNDVLVADCNDGSVYLQKKDEEDDVSGTPSPGLGALGNDWEGFCLRPGLNLIGCRYSDWVAAEYAPTFRLKYREVYL